MGSLWNRSGTIERFADDLRAAGAKAYFFNGGTTSPLTVFQDAGESSAHAHPIVADATGRWPDIFVPYILSYDVRVTTAEGVQLTYTLEIPNPDPIDLTVTIPAQEKIQTGMIHAELVNTTRAGFVRLNGRTMGNATSGGTERANADTSALFTFLYDNMTDTMAPVSGGRGASAALDYAANKTITLPDCRAAVLMGLDDMGNSAGGYFGAFSFNMGSAILPGSSIGGVGVTLLTANMPAHSHTGVTSSTALVTGTESATHTHSGTTTTTGSGHNHTITDTHTNTLPINGSSIGAVAGVVALQGLNASNTSMQSGATGTGSISITGTDGTHTHSFTSGNPSATHTHSIAAHSHTITSEGSGTSFNNLPYSVLVTWYIKL